MTERDLKDPTGKVVFRAVEYDGTRFPAIIFGNIANQLRELNGMTFKESDVFVVAYPKSGTHWCYEIVAMLRNNSSELTKQSPPLIDRLPVEKLRQVSDGCLIFCPDICPEILSKGGVKSFTFTGTQKMLPSRILTS